MAHAILSLFAALVLLPGLDRQLFPGIPASTVVPFAGVLLLLPLVASPALRRAFGRFTRRLPPWFGRGIALAGALALVGKLLLFASGPHSGFLACYGTPAAAAPGGTCERAYANAFGRFGGITRLDPAIDFGPADWNLSFLNAVRFNYYPWVKGNILRDRFPFTARWEGDISRREPTDVRIAYTGEASVTVGADTMTLPPHYGRPATVTMILPGGRQHLLVTYRFDDGARSGGERPVGPWATFRVRLQADGGVPALAPAPLRRRWRLFGHGVDAGALALGAVLVAFYATLLAPEWWPLALVAAGGPAAHAWRTAPGFLGSGQGFLLLGAALLAWVLARPRARVRLGAYFAAFYVAFFTALRSFPHIATVMYRSAGDDWLSYESFARSILELRSLEAGEPVFYMQPFYRYVRFAERLLLGDGDLLVTAFALGALYWALLWAGARLWHGVRRSPAIVGLFAAVWALLWLLASSWPVGSYIQAPLSEYPTWIFLLLAVPMLFLSRGRGWLCGAALLALSFGIRTNHAPAVAGLLALFVIQSAPRRPRRAPAALLVFVAIAMLPLAHNVYFGGRWVPLTSAVGVPAALALPPGRLLAWRHDPAVRQLAQAQIAALLYTGTAVAPLHDGLLSAIFHGLQLAWLTAVGLAIAARRRVSWVAVGLLALPALYLGVHFFYVAEYYYPRHIVAGYLAMGLVALYVIREVGRRDSA